MEKIQSQYASRNAAAKTEFERISLPKSDFNPFLENGDEVDLGSRQLYSKTYGYLYSDSYRPPDKVLIRVKRRDFPTQAEASKEAERLRQLRGLGRPLAKFNTGIYHCFEFLLE